MARWKIALDVIKDVRGTLIFYGWVICESLGSVGMACYMLHKAGRKDEAKALASWAINNLANPAIDFASSYGYAMYPMNIAYKLYYDSAKKLLETYLKL